MSSEITLLLKAHQDGDGEALDRIATILYPELKALARRQARSGPGMGATTLVQETFLKLLSGGSLGPDDRKQFFALTATVMRRIIIDEIRQATAKKRDGRDVTLRETIMGDGGREKAEFLLQVDQMLSLLESEDQRLAQVFECRYFAGLTTAETAQAMGASARSVERFWSAARSRMAELMDTSNP